MSSFSLTALDFYCERIDSTYWSEPFNALTNVGFILVGLYWINLSWRKAHCRWTTFFALNSIVVGVGSFLFHTHANVWSMWVDLVPVFLFILVFFYYTFRNIIKLNFGVSFFASILLMGVGYIMELVKLPWLNRSHIYIHVFFVLLFTGRYLKKKNMDYSELYLLSSFVFLMSLLFRTIDMKICSTLPLGTHFLWHSFNAVLLFILIKISWHQSHFPETVKSS